MEVVAGITLKNLQPRVWDPGSPYYLDQLTAIMISYADFVKNANAKRRAEKEGLRSFLEVPHHIKIYLDNGAFYFLGKLEPTPSSDFIEFIRLARPDWWPIPQDFIPTPQMTDEAQLLCLQKTMEMNELYMNYGCTPVIHVGKNLSLYTKQLTNIDIFSNQANLAIGGMVPNLLRAPKSYRQGDIIKDVLNIRYRFKQKQLHVFGLGGTSTMHIACLLEIDSTDSSGWRNRAARGLIQLPGCGERMVANLGNWRGRPLNSREQQLINYCNCPPCIKRGYDGLIASGKEGFEHRATHNLWIILEEVKWVENQLQLRTYQALYSSRLDNTIYLPIIDEIIKDMVAPTRYRAEQKSVEINVLNIPPFY